MAKEEIERAQEKKSVHTATEITGDSEAEMERIYKSKFANLEFEISDLKSKREFVEVKLLDLMSNFDRVNSSNETLVKKCDMHLIEFSRQNERLEMLKLVNEKLEVERAQLFEQLHRLLQQNGEILTQTLANKDLYHEESKAYVQQVAEMKRQKEALEMKIMEQYKNCPNFSMQKQKYGFF